VHFFWGSFDLAVTRFSGRPAPPHAGGIPHLPDAVAREAYSHEVRPTQAYFSQQLGEFILPYDAVRTAPEPESALMEFLQST
jgi:Family of unknown function (DUF5996)